MSPGRETGVALYEPRFNAAAQHGLEITAISGLASLTFTIEHPGG